MTAAPHLALVKPEESALDLPPGIHMGVPESTYHRNSLGGASAHLLRDLARAPAVYEHTVLHPEDAEDKPAFLIGRAFHCATLEPEEWSSRYCIAPDFGDCRKADNKKARDLWKKENEDKEPLTDTDARRVLAMAASVRRHPLAGPMLANGQAEVTLRWNRGPLRMKARADWWAPGLRIAADLKSTEDARRDAFERDSARYDYHRQAALYTDGLAAVGQPIDLFVFIVCEKSPPHLTALYFLKDQDVQLGRDENDVLLDQLASCVQRGTYPGLLEEIQEISLPRWRRR
jgi:hypothetical protein